MNEKIAITVDPELLEQVEELRARTRESRSAVFRRAARLLLRREEHERRVQAYVRGYREHPETEVDDEAARQLALVALAGVPWGVE